MRRAETAIGTKGLCHGLQEGLMPPDQRVVSESAALLLGQYGVGDGRRGSNPRGVSYFAVDSLGSVTATTDAAGTVTHAVAFDAWGVEKASYGTRIHPFTYTGREVGEASLCFYRARFYQPGVGRFSQEDPVDSIPGMTPFAYVANRPVEYLDPSGLVGVGHHYFPRSVFRDIPGLSQEAFAVFMASTTGPIPGGHGWSTAHALYNKAVEGLFYDWIKQTGKTPAKLTAADARLFLKEIVRSRRKLVSSFLRSIRQSFGAGFKGWRGLTAAFCPIDVGSLLVDTLLMDKEDEKELRELTMMYTHMYIPPASDDFD